MPGDGPPLLLFVGGGRAVKWGCWLYFFWLVDIAPWECVRAGKLARFLVFLPGGL